ncbi:unnamed protein product [Allacma fusca]|uniref:Uncharacterized protein n=1 Tax=Allacma fusca TaxID=39272 RepID=A0A8J2LGV0_9HEXA|nr:unnamed protein product [Allacma fusca]
MEIWQFVERQLAEKEVLAQNLTEAREEIKMLEAKVRQMEGQSDDLKTEVVNQSVVCTYVVIVFVLCLY